MSYPQKMSKTHEEYGQPGYGCDVSQGERALWLAVIQQALVEATLNGKGSEMEIIRREARLWFSPLNEDFCMVCQLAGVSVGQVLTLYKKIRKRAVRLAYRRQLGKKCLRKG